MDRLKEIKQRLEATTEGNWVAKNIPYDNCNDPTIETEDNTYIAQTVYDMQSYTQNHNINADTTFIANSKADMKYLLDFIDNIKR